jgi:putative copper export protein
VRLDAPLARLIRLAAAGLVVGLAWRAWAHTAVAFGLSASVRWENLELAAWESRWGNGWRWQLTAALLLTLCSSRLRSWRQAWPLTAIASVVLCYVVPLLGHAAGDPPRVMLHGTHLLGGGVWLGTLAAASIALRASAASSTPEHTQARMRNDVLRHFSPVAFTGSGAIVLTGLVAAWWYVGSVTNLVSTTYGRLLLVKLFLVADVAACGFLNWRHFKSPRREEERSRQPKALIAAEIVLAACVVVVTAVLTETEHP